jgi:hypothetical protein
MANKSNTATQNIWFCCKISLTIQDVVTTASSSLLQSVAKIFFATKPRVLTRPKLLIVVVLSAVFRRYRRAALAARTDATIFN